LSAAGIVKRWESYGRGKDFPASEPLPAKDLFDWIKQGDDRGAANVLLSLAADYTGRMRSEDVRVLEELGRMLREAGRLNSER
jgi:hypothetical protein